MYFHRPIPGRAFRPFRITEMVSVSADDISSWNFKKVVRWGRQDFSIFTNSKGEEIMQSLQAIRFVRCKPGEDNINSKLTNAQGLEIFKRATSGEDHATLAQEYGVEKSTVSAIKNLRQRTSITLDYLNGKQKEKPATGVVAKRDKNHKLSPSLASFIRKDHTERHLDNKALASKYCVSQRTIQRILKGEMYKNG